MTFAEFKRMVYHTAKAIRIPGSRTIINKSELMVKGKFNQKKADIVLLDVYESEDYISR